MIVIADAGPLIHLSAIGRLSALQRIAGHVLVPKAVFDEVVVAGAGLPGSQEVRAATWISVLMPERTDLVDALLASGLHRGEAEAIAIAVEKRADYLVIDERQGRLTAQAMSLTVVGTVGILVAAKTRGEFDALAPVLQQLHASGLWLSDALVREVLAAVGEAPDR